MKSLSKFFLIGILLDLMLIPLTVSAQTNSPSPILPKTTYSKLTLTLSPGVTWVRKKSALGQVLSPTPKITSNFAPKIEEYIVLRDYLGNGRVYIAKSPLSSLEKPSQTLENSKKFLVNYLPYGTHEGNFSESQLEETLGFTGQKYIASAKLIRFPSRFYSSTLGIFLTPDNVEGPNRYTYVSGNPISYSDFTGREKVKITKYQAMRDFSNMNPRGTLDPVKIDEELMSDDAYKALSIATTLPLAGIFGVELGGAAVTYCLTYPIACHAGAGVAADLALGDALPPGASLSPIGQVEDLGQFVSTIGKNDQFLPFTHLNDDLPDVLKNIYRERRAVESVGSIKLLGKASTARVNPTKLINELPANEMEEYLMLDVVTNFESYLPRITNQGKNQALNDPRWPSSEGWAKRGLIIETSTGTYDVHFVYNEQLGFIDDFKIVGRKMYPAHIHSPDEFTRFLKTQIMH